MHYFSEGAFESLFIYFIFIFFFLRDFIFNCLAITEEREMYLIILISKQCMENYQFPSTYTAISGLLDDVDNSKQ